MEDDIAEKLRRENSEQFFILVRMHLSFIIDMNTDENDSPTDKPKSFKWGFSKKSKSVTSENSNRCNINPNKAIEIFLLTDENVIQLYQLIDILSDEKNVCQEGIFRRTGSLSRQQQLRKLLVLGGTLSVDGSEELPFSVHDMASVLKGMLADTPEPLLLNQNYQAYCHLAATNFSDGRLLQNCESRLIDALRLLLLLLPALDRRLAQRLLMLLHQTTLHESSNRMSPSALSTMFSPHVMCPRRLSPEALHTDSQSFSPILSFMIERAPVLFTTPPQLAADIAAYLSRRQQRRLLSPNGEDLNESVSEHTAANTIFTFVDRQMSGVADSKDGVKANASTTTVTDTALAQLYAHIQALPESQNKRRLIKQFNRENGCGTPLQFQRAQKQKSIGQSLKKHIFNKSLMSKTVKKSLMLHDQGFGYQSITESPTCKPNLKTVTVESTLNDTPKLSNDPELMNTPVKSTIGVANPPRAIESPKRGQSPDLSATPRVLRMKLESNLLLTSTPQVANILLGADLTGNCSTPIVSNHIMRRGSMSPITKSTQKMPKAMQESIMTPRSRKPVIINCDPPTSLQQSINKDHSTIRNETMHACDSSLTSSTSSSSRSIKNDSDFVSTDESCPSTSYCIKYKRINSADSSKFGAKFSSAPYSNLTNADFAKKKKRIFQESFSNKSNDSERRLYSLDQSDSEIINERLLETSDTEQNLKDKKTASLTAPFRQYLQCRSIFTKSPVDLSFVSEPDDFGEMKVENVQNMSENKMSASLLYFLNGNRIEDFSDMSHQKVLLEKSKCNSNYGKMSETLEDNVNKENVSPGNKRLASQIDNIDDMKKVLLTKKDSKYKKSNTLNNPIQDSFELNECKDYIDCDVRITLRETNL
ncbi:rho GTPase activating protein at 54D isoform X1 [Arctopsyche grandis]|uniref:rho GTPase activating protein at 54D isoform X1 n=1 Tax=Arctopsyche grandis TaxID=121162 RepID=UPI00406D9A72